MEMTKEQLEENFKKQVKMHSGIGRQRQLELLEIAWAERVWEKKEKEETSTLGEIIREELNRG